MRKHGAESAWVHAVACMVIGCWLSGAWVTNALAGPVRQAQKSRAEETRVESKANPGPAKGVALSLADAVFLTLRQNRTIQSAYAERTAQKFELRVAENRFTPQLAISSNAQVQSVGGSTFSNADLTPNATVLLPTGATFGFAWANTASEAAGIQTRTSATQISLVQPLLRGGGVDATLAPVRAARIGEAINRLHLKETVSQTIAQVITGYRALLRAQEELRLAQAALKRSQDLVDVNRVLINAGRMASVDIVQSEVDVENQRIRILEANRSLEDARLSLLTLMSVDLGTSIAADEGTDPKRVRPELTGLMKIALEERADYLAQMLVVEQVRLGIVVAENERLWDLSVFARGTFGKRTITGVADNARIADTTVGASLNIPLNDLRREQPYVQATTNLKTAELQLATIKQGVEQQVRSAVSQVDIRWQQHEFARRAHELALRAVEIEKDKLKVGRSSNFQVRSLESDLRSAEQQKLSAAINYLGALTILDLQLGTTLKTWHISLKD